MPIVTMALRNSRNTRRATGSCELTSILSSITGLPRTTICPVDLFAPLGSHDATALANPVLTYYHTRKRARRPLKRARVQGGGNAVASITTTGQRLNARTLLALAPTVAKPRSSGTGAGLTTGIVHIGLGAFHRAHQAVYTDDSLNRTPGPWGICGVSLRSPDTRDALAPQDCLYTVAVRDASGDHLRVIGSITETLVPPEDSAAVLD